MAQIAAEEPGLALDRVEVQVGDSARGPFAVDLRRLVHAAFDGTRGARGGRPTRSGTCSRSRPSASTARSASSRSRRPHRLTDGGSSPLEEITGLLEDGQILGQGARGPNPAGMRVLTFGVQVAEVAVDVETGEVRVERIHAIHDVGRVINPLGAREPDRGRDHPGDRAHVLRGPARRPADGRDP